MGKLYLLLLALASLDAHEVFVPDTEQALGVPTTPTYVFLINQTFRYQFREVVLANAIGTLADLVGKSTQVALKVGATGDFSRIHEERLLG